MSSEPQSLRAPRYRFDARRELTYITGTVQASAETALQELDTALHTSDLDAAVSALRRLASAGELGRLAARRLEQRPR